MIDPGGRHAGWLRVVEVSPLRRLVRQMQDVRARLDRLDPPPGLARRETPRLRLLLGRLVRRP